MATTSSAPGVKAQIVTALSGRAGLSGVTVEYSWPATTMPAGTSAIEAIFLGGTEVDSEIATIKAGRKHRNETVQLDVVIWVIQPGGTDDTAQTCEARAYTLLKELEDALADDVQIGIPASVQWAVVVGHDVDIVKAAKGWACQIVAHVEWHARLT